MILQRINMSFSNDCVTEELDYFSEPISQFEIEKTQLIEYTPITSLDKNDKIHFRIIGQSDEFIKLKSSFIILNLEVNKIGGATTLSGDTTPTIKFDHSAREIKPVNNLLHSIFSDVYVSLNNKKISADHSNYAHRAYFQTLLNFSKEDQDNLLTASLWKKDGKTDGSFNDRYDCFEQDSKTINIQLAGRLFIDFFNQPLNLLNNINIDIVLIRQHISFPFMYTADNYDYKIKNISLYVKKVKINSNVRKAIDYRLLKEPAKYPFTRGEVKTFEIVQNNKSVTHDNIFLGKLPTRLFIAFVDSDSYSGVKDSNPFKFQHFDIDFLVLYKNGVQIPSHPFTPNFKGKEAKRSYLSIFHATNTFYSEKSINISYDEFLNGYTMWGFDLTSDQCDSDNFYHPTENGNIKLEVKFKKQLAKNVTCILYADYDDILMITHDRNIITDFTL